MISHCPPSGTRSTASEATVTHLSDRNIVTDGLLANMELHVGAWSFNTVIPKTATYHLNRSISVTTFQVASQENVDACYALDTYEEAWQCYGPSPHSAGHAGTGGTASFPIDGSST
jgi:tyrosinase